MKYHKNESTKSDWDDGCPSSHAYDGCTSLHKSVDTEVPLLSPFLDQQIVEAFS